MPPKSKARSAPNQHDKRHESGLAPPGKRVGRKHSNGHLNGHLDGKPVPSAHPTAYASGASTSHGAAVFRSADPQDALPPTTPGIEHVDCAQRDRTYSDASLEESGPCGEMADIHHEHAAISPNAEAQPSLPRYNPTTSGSTSSSTSAILSSYPLRDAISILILLLSLPPTLVLVIQTLFASLTFVPPSTSISLSTLPNIKEMFNSPNLGYPALATILIVDLIFWVCWLPVWKPIQGVFLDLSQAVIAVSLSGATASSGGPTYSIATTTAIVCIVHVLRYRAIHLTALDYLRSVLHKLDIGLAFDVPIFATSYASLPPIDKGWVYTVIRAMLGIHIVSQGVTTAIRHSLVKANEQNANIPVITRSEPETSNASDPVSRTGASTAEGPSHGPPIASTDSRLQGPSPARRDSRPRESNAKKKKKLVDRLRSRQPLWAAIASTKVTFVKEMEQRDAVVDEREAARMHTHSTNTMPDDTYPSNARAWMRDVRDTEIFFSVQLPENTTGQGVNTSDELSSIGAGIDRSKPFYVRINGAAWSSTRIGPVASDDETSFGPGERYDGEIFGLAPLSSYLCEFVDITSHNTLCGVSIITQPAPTPEQAASTSVGPQHQALRPASPITTLKQSIQAAEAKLNEARNRGKKIKKDQRTVHADIRRESHGLKSKLDSSGGTDDKQERRLMQINQHKAQAEEVATDVKKQIDDMGEIPADQVAESDAKKTDWQSVSNSKRSANKDLDNAKAEADREMSSLKSELQQAESKKEKSDGRRIQRMQDLEKLKSRQEAEMTAKQRRDFDRAQVNHARETEEANTKAVIESLDTDWMVYQQKTQEAYQQMTNLQNMPTGQPPPYPGHSSPPTPEHAHSALANGSSALTSPQTNGFPPMLPHGFPHASPFHSAHPSLTNPSFHTQPGAPPQPRARSSSMLSQYSGFTDPGDDSHAPYVFPPHDFRAQHSWPLMPGGAPHPQQAAPSAFPQGMTVMAAGGAAGGALMDDRKESEGSGSGGASLNNDGSTGSNSPRPDARVFVPAGKNGTAVGGAPPVGPAVGTIGPPGGGKKGPQSPVANGIGKVLGGANGR